MNAHRVLVVGGGYAGALVATRAARRGGARVAVTLLSEASEMVERVRLADYVCHGREVVHDLRTELGTGVRFCLGRAVALDGGRGQVRIEGGQQDHDEPFDSCVIATGSVRDDRGVPGVTVHACDVAARAGAHDIRRRLAALRGRGRLLVCGGGLTAIELVAELAEAYPSLVITLVTEGRLGPGLSVKGRAAVVGHLARRGVQVHEQIRVRSVDAGGVVHSDGRFDGELVIWCTGMRAAPVAAALGLAVDGAGRALVDVHLRSTSHPNVAVVGDAAALSIGHNRLRMGCVVALPMAVHAADEIVARLDGRTGRPFRFRFYFQCISLGRRAGLIQFTGADDSPRERVITGRPAAMVKEWICRYAARRPFRERRSAPAAVGRRRLVASE